MSSQQISISSSSFQREIIASLRETGNVMSAQVICLSSSSSGEEEGSPPKRLKIDKLTSSSQNASCSRESYSRILVEKDKKVVKPQLVVATKIPLTVGTDDILRIFIRRCSERRDDEDTRKVLQRLKRSFSNLSPSQLQDDHFKSYIGKCLEKITKGLAADIYTPILDLQLEIKRRLQTEQADKDDDEEMQVSRKDMQKIKVLENSIKKCLLKIKELEEKEVDFDDDDDSAYIQEDKYKKRLVRLCNVLGKITHDKAMKKLIFKKKIKRNDIPDEMTGISLVDKAILNFVNADIKKVNQMKHLESTQHIASLINMPEYSEILQCVQECNKKYNLDLSKEKMSKLAKRAFLVVANFLKRQRMNDSRFYIQSLMQDDEKEDPAVKDIQLRKKLQDNKKHGDEKLEEIFQKYVEKQSSLSGQQQDMEEESENDLDDGDGEIEYSDKNSMLSDESQDRKDENSSKSSEGEPNLEECHQKLKVIINTKSSREDGTKTHTLLGTGEDKVLVLDDSDDGSSCNADGKKAQMAPLIKVCAFARPPSAWVDTSPEKVRKKPQLAIQQTLQKPPAAPTECIDLAKENERRLVNPLASAKQRSTLTTSRRVVIVKNVINNNFNIPL